MKRSPLIALALILCSQFTPAQNRKEDFVLPAPDTIIPHSLYNNLVYLDSRRDTTTLGIVQQGAFNAKARVLPKIPLGTQLKNSIAALIDSTAAHGTMLIQMREFRFAEVTKSFSEKGYCFVRADFYQEIDDRFYKIDHIDTLITVKSMDVTKGTLKKGAAFLVDLIAGHLTKTAAESVSLNYPQIRNIDSVEKSHMAAYTDTVYTDGLYYSYASFRDQVPDVPVMVKEKNETVSDVRITGADGKWHKVNRRQIFAVVVSGRLYVATDVDYYPMARFHDDFLFTGRLKVAPENNDILAAQLMFGLLGGLILSGNDALCEVRLDHLTGSFVVLRQLHIATEP